MIPLTAFELKKFSVWGIEIQINVECQKDEK